MFQLKTFEIRDKATFIPALAIRVAAYELECGADRWLLRRAGYDSPLILLIHLERGAANFDPYDWGDRTMLVAHQVIESKWAELESGSVVDVEFVLGESTSPKVSERLESHWP